jgi:parallel beta-helix repeat protein
MGSAQWVNCSSIANTSAGFLLTNVSNSSLDNCKALTNGEDGFDCEGTTNNVTIINNQALGNSDYGFEFASTTTQCHIRNNIAQNNGSIGFNNSDANTEKHQFYGNFAQANTDGNYYGVALVTNPGLTTSSFANVVP